MARPRLRTAAAAGCAALVLSGCLGSFAAFNKLNGWTRAASDSVLVQEAIFLALTPVYAVTITADLLVLNAYEFWTGRNPALAQRNDQTGPSGLRLVQRLEVTSEAKAWIGELWVANRRIETAAVVQVRPGAPVAGFWIDAFGRAAAFRVAPAAGGSGGAVIQLVDETADALAVGRLQIDELHAHPMRLTMEHLGPDRDRLGFIEQPKAQIDHGVLEILVVRHDEHPVLTDIVRLAPRPIAE